MRNTALVMAACLALAACGGEKTVYSDAEGNEVKVTREGDGDASEIKIESADGSATVNIEGESSNAKLPFGLKLYPGAKIVSTMVGNSDGKSGGLYVMESSGKRDAIFDWYKRALVDGGFKIESEITTEELRSVTASKAGGSLSLQVVPSDSGSSITLVAGDN